MTAGTILHASKLPLTVWFWAAYLMATHSNGISALQLQKQLGIGSYRSAWLLAHKLRASMVDPERNSLSGLVEIDEASLPFRTKDDPPTGGQGRSHDGKMLIVGAIELPATGDFEKILFTKICSCASDLPIPAYPSSKGRFGPSVHFSWSVTS